MCKQLRHPCCCVWPCRTVTDVTVQPLGIIIAAISVASSGMQQILCGTLQRQHNMQSHQLLANTAPVQGAMLLLVGPLVDKALTGQWVGQYTVTTPGLACLLLSCLISVGVNISQFMCLGRFSAVTFQVSLEALPAAAGGSSSKAQQGNTARSSGGHTRVRQQAAARGSSRGCCMQQQGHSRQLQEVQHGEDAFAVGRAARSSGKGAAENTAGAAAEGAPPLQNHQEPCASFALGACCSSLDVAGIVCCCRCWVTPRPSLCC